MSQKGLLPDSSTQFLLEAKSGFGLKLLTAISGSGLCACVYVHACMHAFVYMCLCVCFSSFKFRKGVC